MGENNNNEASKKPKKEYEIIVNGQKREVPDKVVTFKEIVTLAFPEKADDPNVTFVAIFRKAHKPHEGSLVAGGTVEVKKEGTIFNVTFTNKS